MFLTSDKMQFDRDNCKPVFSSEFKVVSAWLDSCLHIKNLGTGRICTASVVLAVIQLLRISSDY